MVLDKTFTDCFAKEWIASWNQRDINAILSRYGEDVQYSSPTVTSNGTHGGGKLAGRIALSNHYQRLHNDNPSLQFQLLDALFSVNTMCIYYQVDTTVRAIEWLRFNESGKVVEASCSYNSIPTSHAKMVTSGNIDSAFASSFAEEWAVSWNTHDLPRVLSHYTEDFHMTSPFIARIAGNAQGTLYGKLAVGDYWTKALTKFTDLHFTVHDVLFSVDSICIYYDSVLGLRAVEWLMFDEDRMVVAASGSYNDFPLLS